MSACDVSTKIVGVEQQTRGEIVLKLVVHNLGKELNYELASTSTGTICCSVIAGLAGCSISI